MFDPYPVLGAQLSGFMRKRHLAANNAALGHADRGKMPLPQPISILNIVIEIAIGIEIGFGKRHSDTDFR